ncbi:MAG: DNA polymerase I [Clostridia bacterium]|nr:DNA polymerase I [Clostridia bacterium]
MKNFLIIDGNSIINRAYYGIRPLSNKAGLPTNAIYGMISILKKHMDSLKPDYAVVAFDVRAKTFRHHACDFYKATRKGMPDELAAQLPYAKKCLEYMGFNVIEKEGYEADDLIGTAAKIGEADPDIHSYVLTGDRDSLQLITDQCSLILVKTKEDIVYDPEKFLQDYGVTPTQYIDVKAIMGDSSDNIPGVNGIGEKGAFKLISDFGSLDRIYDEFEGSSLSPSMKEKLRNGKEMAYTSKFLATIVKDAPIDKAVEDFKYHGINNDKLYDFFTEMEFESFIKKFNLLPSLSEFDDFFEEAVGEEEKTQTELKAPATIGLLDGIRNETVAVYSHDHKLYICSEKYNFVYEYGDYDEFLKNNNVICYDVKSVLKEHPVNCIFDVMLAAYVVSPSDSSYAIEKLCVSYLEKDFVPEYSAQLLYMLYTELSKKLKEAGTEKILTDIEIPLARVLCSMEKEGFRIDVNGLKSYSRQLLSLASSFKERIYMLAGEEFNVNSPAQLSEVLFEKMGLKHGKKTKTGYSTDAAVLEELRSESEIIQEILDYRQVMKLNSTYCEGLIKVADENNKVHTTFNQTVAVTGRLSSTEPNLQNIPVRTELGKNFRRYFIAKNEDYTLIDADYSQIELKVLAHLSGDINMLHAFNTGTDIHAVTASQIFGVNINNVTSEMRSRAKTVNFGIVYGMGEHSLAKDLRISYKEAKNYISSYFATYPQVHAYINNLIESATEKGCAKTMFDRIRYIPELSSSNRNVKAFGERVAMNSPIQGSAADIIKIAMINVSRALEDAKIDARLILQVHDELIVESHKSCVNQAKEILQREMENAVKLSVPLTAQTSVGDNWFDAK